MKDITLDQQIKKDKQIKKKKPLIRKKNHSIIKKNNQHKQRHVSFARQFQKPQHQKTIFIPHTPKYASTYYGRKLRVVGIHPNLTSQQLYKLFSQQGALEVCRVDQDNFGRSLTTATVVYYSAENAELAIEKLNKTKIMNSIINVQKWNPGSEVENSETRQRVPKEENRRIINQQNGENRSRVFNRQRGRHFRKRRN